MTVAWVAVGVAAVGAGASAYSADKAAGAADEAARTKALAESESLEYLQGLDEIPQQFREGALTKLGGVYGLEGGVGSQQELIDQAKASPLYASIMGGQEAGEESILRNAAATGGLRSGNTSYNLADYNTQLQNSALLESYNQQISGLTGLAGTPTNEADIASAMAGIGDTEAWGITASAQAEQEGLEQVIGALSGAVDTYAKSSGDEEPGGTFSDSRLKKNIQKVGEVKGFNWYTWDWNELGKKLGLTGSSNGVLADEIYKTNKDCVSIKDLFMVVDYRKLLGGAS